MKILATICLLVLMVMPISLGAAGLVPDCGTECNTCDLIGMANGVINFLITILTIIGVFVLMAAGFKMVTSGGNSGAWAEAKKMFGNVIIGFFLVLAAWLIIDTILIALTGKGLSVLTSVNC